LSVCLKKVTDSYAFGHDVYAERIYRQRRWCCDGFAKLWNYDFRNRIAG